MHKKYASFSQKPAGGFGAGGANGYDRRGGDELNRTQPFLASPGGYPAIHNSTQQGFGFKNSLQKAKRYDHKVSQNLQDRSFYERKMREQQTDTHNFRSLQSLPLNQKQSELPSLPGPDTKSQYWELDMQVHSTKHPYIRVPAIFQNSMQANNKAGKKALQAVHKQMKPEHGRFVNNKHYRIGSQDTQLTQFFNQPND